MKIKIQRNTPEIKLRIDGGETAMIAAVSEQILDYADPPVAEGTLRDSAFISSRPKEGVLIWNTPYAKKQYYTHKTKNMWAEKAVNSHKKELQKVAQNAFAGGMNKK